MARPNYTLDTDGLTLRLIEESDWDLFHQLLTDPQVIRQCFNLPTLEDIRNKFEDRLKPWTPESESWLCFVVCDSKTGQPYGVTGFVLEQGEAEIGYLFLPEHHGKGYATRSLKAVLEWAFEVHSIQCYNAIVTQGNIASEKVLKKCGFDLVKVDPLAYEIGGQRFDDHIYQLNQSEKL